METAEEFDRRLQEERRRRMEAADAQPQTQPRTQPIQTSQDIAFAKAMDEIYANNPGANTTVVDYTRGGASPGRDIYGRSLNTQPAAQPAAPARKNPDDYKDNPGYGMYVGMANQVADRNESIRQAELDKRDRRRNFAVGYAVALKKLNANPDDPDAQEVAKEAAKGYMNEILAGHEGWKGELNQSVIKRYGPYTGQMDRGFEITFTKENGEQMKKYFDLSSVVGAYGKDDQFKKSFAAALAYDSGAAVPTGATGGGIKNGRHPAEQVMPNTNFDQKDLDWFRTSLGEFDKANPNAKPEERAAKIQQLRADMNMFASMRGGEVSATAPGHQIQSAGDILRSADSSTGVVVSAQKQAVEGGKPADVPPPNVGDAKKAQEGGTVDEKGQRYDENGNFVSRYNESLSDGSTKQTSDQSESATIKNDPNAEIELKGRYTHSRKEAWAALNALEKAANTSEPEYDPKTGGYKPVTFHAPKELVSVFDRMLGKGERLDDGTANYQISDKNWEKIQTYLHGEEETEPQAQPEEYDNDLSGVVSHSAPKVKTSTAENKQVSSPESQSSAPASELTTGSLSETTISDDDVLASGQWRIVGRSKGKANALRYTGPDGEKIIYDVKKDKDGNVVLESAGGIRRSLDGKILQEGRLTDEEQSVFDNRNARVLEKNKSISDLEAALSSGRGKTRVKTAKINPKMTAEATWNDFSSSGGYRSGMSDKQYRDYQGSVRDKQFKILYESGMSPEEREELLQRAGEYHKPTDGSKTGWVGTMEAFQGRQMAQTIDTLLLYYDELRRAKDDAHKNWARDMIARIQTDGIRHGILSDGIVKKLDSAFAKLGK